MSYELDILVEKVYTAAHFWYVDEAKYAQNSHILYTFCYVWFLEDYGVGNPEIF